MEAIELLLENAMGTAIAILPFVYGIVEFVKKTKIPNAYMPYVSVGVAILLAILAALYVGEDMVVYGLAGFISGSAASGVYDMIKAPQYIKEQ